ncbi:MAG: YfhO family protein [Bacteroidetes bacterium]|nr:YfhO family protein [Bacteroidota bacterium]
MTLKEKLLKKSNLWHLAAIGIFLLISCAYFYPALQGYSLKQSDIVNFTGSSREIQDYRENDGDQVLWTNSMFSGMPATQISVIYEGTWLSRFLVKAAGLWFPFPVFCLLVYFLGFYVLSQSLRIKPLIGVIGSIAFGLSSYSIIILEVGHNSKALAIGFAAFMVAGFIMAYRFKNWILGVALSSVFMMIELAANHIQITYYMMFILLLIGIVELVRYVQKSELLKFFKITGLLLVGYVLAIMVNYGNIFGTMEYAANTIRGGTELTVTPTGESNKEIKTEGLDRDYVTAWSYGRSETFSFIVPNFKGGQSIRLGSNEANKNILKNADPAYRSVLAENYQYWGDQPGTSGPVYLGVIVVFLAFLAVVYVKDKYKWALLTITLLVVAMSWGKNFVSVLVILPILLYMVNMFLDEKKQLVFSLANTALLFLVILAGDVIVAHSLTDFFLDVLPGYNKFRAVTIVLSVAELCIPLLAVLFLQQLITAKDEIQKNLKGFYSVSGGMAIIMLAFLVAPSAFNTFLSAQEINYLQGISDPATYDQYADFFTSLENVRIEIFRKDVLRSFVFLVLGGALVFAFVRTSFSKYAFLGVLGSLVLFDLLFVDMRYLNTDGTGKKYDQWTETYNRDYPFKAGDGEKQILALEIQANPSIQFAIDSALTVLEKELKDDKAVAREKELKRDYLTFRMLNRNSNFRVFEEGNPFNSSYTSYFNKSVGGYHGAKLRRYQELIEFHLSQNNPSVIDMLNVKYYLRPQYDNSGVVVNTALTRKNTTALGNAWFSKKITTVNNADEEIVALAASNTYEITAMKGVEVRIDGTPVETKILTGREKVEILLPGMAEPMAIEQMPYEAVGEEALALIADSAGLNWMYDVVPDSLVSKIFKLKSAGRAGWNPAEETIVDKRFMDKVSAESYTAAGTIEMVSYSPDKLVYTSNSPDKQLAVFSEIYYPEGWKAYVDGTEVPVLRVNYVLRAIELTAGEHKIEFVYELESYKKSGMIANAGSVGILLLLAFGIFIAVKKDTTEGSETV